MKAGNPPNAPDLQSITEVGLGGHEGKAPLSRLSDRLFLDQATFADASGSDGLAPIPAVHLALLDDLVGSRQQRVRKRNACGIGCFPVDHETEARRPLKGQIGRLGAFENREQIGGRIDHLFAPSGLKYGGSGTRPRDPRAEASRTRGSRAGAVLV